MALLHGSLHRRDARRAQSLKPLAPLSLSPHYGPMLCGLPRRLAAADRSSWRSATDSPAPFSLRAATTKAAIGLAILWAVIDLGYLPTISPDLPLGQRPLLHAAAVADLHAPLFCSLGSFLLRHSLLRPPAGLTRFSFPLPSSNYLLHYWYYDDGVPGVAAAGVQPRAGSLRQFLWSGWPPFRRRGTLPETLLQPSRRIPPRPAL